jgi:cobalt-zinc-cadmium efflux system protein
MKAEPGRPPESAREHEHGSHLRDISRRRLILALVLTALFMAVEVVAGLLSGSLALLSDAGHMVTDAGALGLALWAQALGERARTGRKTFGYRRAEILAAATNGVVLGVTALLVIIEAVRRIGSPPPVQGQTMLPVAVTGLIVNLIAAWVLSRGGTTNINVRAAAAHVLADALGSLAAIVAAILVLGPGWMIADPLLSIAISVLILSGAWRLLRQSVHVLMEGVPANVDVTQLERIVRETPGVVAVHDLHVWSIADDVPVVTVHVVLASGSHGVEVVRDVCQRLKQVLGEVHVTVQPEAQSREDELLAPESLVRPPGRP